eukprot:scaffold9790_cov112-Skeletonema_dohrnii-CCMP3373.AAC.5
MVSQSTSVTHAYYLVARCALAKGDNPFTYQQGSQPGSQSYVAVTFTYKGTRRCSQLSTTSNINCHLFQNGDDNDEISALLLTALILP